jgi:hypothetical protein
MAVRLGLNSEDYLHMIRSTLINIILKNLDI